MKKFQYFLGNFRQQYFGQHSSPALILIAREFLLCESLQYLEVPESIKEAETADHISI